MNMNQKGLDLVATVYMRKLGVSPRVIFLKDGGEVPEETGLGFWDRWNANLELSLNTRGFFVPEQNLVVVKVTGVWLEDALVVVHELRHAWQHAQGWEMPMDLPYAQRPHEIDAKAYAWRHIGVPAVAANLIGGLAVGILGGLAVKAAMKPLHGRLRDTIR